MSRIKKSQVLGLINDLTELDGKALNAFAAADLANTEAIAAQTAAAVADGKAVAAQNTANVANNTADIALQISGVNQRNIETIYSDVTDAVFVVNDKIDTIDIVKLTADKLPGDIFAGKYGETSFEVTLDEATRQRISTAKHILMFDNGVLMPDALNVDYQTGVTAFTLTSPLEEGDVFTLLVTKSQSKSQQTPIQ